MQLPTIAAILFAIAAMGGLFLATRHFIGKSLPRPVALAHGGLAATAIICLIVAWFNGVLQARSTIALVLFLAAAMGGFFLFYHDLTGKTLPSKVVIAHALAAITAFLLLVSTLIY